MKKYIKGFGFLFFCWIVLGANNLMAQCAMCRVSVENNVSAGDISVGSGLNTGILYLMVVPYISFMVLAFLWYRSSKKHTMEKEKLQKVLARITNHNN